MGESIEALRRSLLLAGPGGSHGYVVGRLTPQIGQPEACEPGFGRQQLAPQAQQQGDDRDGRQRQLLPVAQGGVDTVPQTHQRCQQRRRLAGDAALGQLLTSAAPDPARQGQCQQQQSAGDNPSQHRQCRPQPGNIQFQTVQHRQHRQQHRLRQHAPALAF